jgi:hypothetical protein
MEEHRLRIATGTNLYRRQSSRLGVYPRSNGGPLVLAITNPTSQETRFFGKAGFLS